MIKSLSALVTLSVLLICNTAHADTITGVAVDADNFAIASGDGWYDFYIPLSGAETYDGTLVSDDCKNDQQDKCKGSLTMKMVFDVLHAGDTTFVFDFDDLDVAGYADGNNFYELLSLQVWDSSGNFYTFSESDIAGALTGDKKAQQLAVTLSVESGPVNFSMTFGSGFKEVDGRHYRNTLESVRGYVIAVPEPATIALLGLGLLVIAIAGRRRQKH